MLSDIPLHLSRSLLAAYGTRVNLHYPGRIPTRGAVLLVSNHRSFLDAPLLMTAINRPVRFACHHYMSKVPALKEIVTAFGCFPLDAPEQRGQHFFQQAVQFLQTHQVVGIFPEGAEPMLQPTCPQDLKPFQRGFAHLALRVLTESLTILPVAIAATQETQYPVAPLQLFNWFDPSEPLFNRPGWHPAVVYHQVNLLIGRPIHITDTQRAQYRGKQAGPVAKELSQVCHDEIANLLTQGF